MKSEVYCNMFHNFSQEKKKKVKTNLPNSTKSDIDSLIEDEVINNPAQVDLNPSDLDEYLLG